MDSLEYWNLRAETFGGMNSPAHAGSQGGCAAGYMPRLIEKLALEDGQSVFDMGCANGTLAIPLARAGHAVTARDFSPRMIARLQAAAQAEELPIDAALMAWEDDWEACGIHANSVDVAVASRSVPYCEAELADALRKLDRVARLKAAVTVSATSAPAYDERLCEHLGRDIPVPKGHVHVVDALAEMRRLPEVSYIPFERPMRFADKNMAWLELRKLAGEEELDAHEEGLFERYATEHFSVQEVDGQTVYQLDYRLDVEWAFICWRTGNDL
ncbi:MAG: class I SAM-dependent methyltransferase [Eggerthellaceae bacterium]|nr:class I SAM-dependent methyltransferase [Eggerthellaceae bacterium]